MDVNSDAFANRYEYSAPSIKFSEDGSSDGMSFALVAAIKKGGAPTKRFVTGAVYITVVSGTDTAALCSSSCCECHSRSASLIRDAGAFKGEWPAPAAEAVLEINRRVPPDLPIRERQAWLLTVAQAQRSLGQDEVARSTLISAGLGADLCVAADKKLHLFEQNFSYDDHPEELIVGDQEGSVYFDFDLDSSGAVAKHRILYSLPAGLFDAPSAKGLATMRYEPPSRSGKPAPCRGITQPIVWRLESNDDPPLPSFNDPAEDPTS